MVGDEVNHRAHLGLRGGVRAGAELFKLLAPPGREISIQIESLLFLVDLDGKSIIVGHRAFRQHAVIGAAGFGRVARHHQPRFVRMALPVAVRILDAHGKYPAVAVHVFDAQPVNVFLVVGIRASRRTDNLRPALNHGAHRPFGAIRIDARANVHHPAIEAAGDVLALAVEPCQRIDQVQRCRSSGKLTGVNIRVHPVGRFVGGRTGLPVGRGEHPDVLAFVALADAFDGKQLGEFLDELMEDAGEFRIAVETVVLDIHGFLSIKRKPPVGAVLQR